MLLIKCNTDNCIVVCEKMSQQSVIQVAWGRDDSDYFIFQMLVLICAENNSTKVSYENPVMVFLKHEDYIAEFWDGAKPK